MRNLRGDKEHGRGILASGDTGSASDTGRGVHRKVRGFLRDRDRVTIGCTAGVHGNKSARLNDSIERAAIGDEVLNDRKCLRAPGFDGDGLAIMETAHVKL